MIKFIKKYCYISIPILSIIVLLIVNFFYKLNMVNISEHSDTIIGISGTLIGFLFTAMTIFFSLNKDSTYMQNFKKYNHHIIFSRLISFGIIALCINIISWLFNLNENIFIFSFIIGIEETVMAAYYIYRLSLNSLN